jgi:hypothetical protein
MGPRLILILGQISRNAIGLAAAMLLLSAAILALTQMWLGHVSALDLALVGCLYLFSSSVHRRRVKYHT